MKYKIRANKTKTGVNYHITIPAVILNIYGWLKGDTLTYSAQKEGLLIKEDIDGRKERKERT